MTNWLNVYLALERLEALGLVLLCYVLLKTKFKRFVPNSSNINEQLNGARNESKSADNEYQNKYRSRNNILSGNCVRDVLAAFTNVVLYVVMIQFYECIQSQGKFPQYQETALMTIVIIFYQIWF